MQLAVELALDPRGTVGHAGRIPVTHRHRELCGDDQNRGQNENPCRHTGAKRLPSMKVAAAAPQAVGLAGRFSTKAWMASAVSGCIMFSAMTRPVWA